MAFRSIKGFTLIEALIVVAIMAIVATITFSDSLETVIRKKINAEDQALALLERDIRVSFENTDLSGTNIASLIGEIGTGDIATAFSTNTNPVYTTTNANDWFAKIARIRGTAAQLGVAPLPNSQPALAKLLFNHSGNARLLVARPADPLETDKQRFMLISLVAQPGELTLPVYQNNTTWFDAIWNTDFTSRSATTPGNWNSLLSTDQIAQWNGDSSGTNLYRLRVLRITLPRFVVTVNNNHLTKYAWVYANNGGYSFTATSNPGVTQQTNPILAGRQIRVTCGLPANPAAALQTHLFLLREDAIINVDSL